MPRILSYEEKATPIHSLSGITKLIFFLAWSVTGMLTYDTRILIIMFVFSLIQFRVAKVEKKQVWGVLKVILVFMIVNLLAIYVFSPNHGTELYGTKTMITNVGNRFDLTQEQLFYEFNVLMKYLVIVPAVFSFVLTTDPSEFAASLNSVGISYKVAYSVAIALRYIPDVQADFEKIKHAQEARGIEMSSKAGLMDRIKNTSAILFPLIFTSMDRIDTISNAMELRCFGKYPKRTWYAAKKLEKADYAVIIITVIAMAACLIVTFHDGNRFYNPFI